jgi:hypothetical protein
MALARMPLKDFDAIIQGVIADAAKLVHRGYVDKVADPAELDKLTQKIAREGELHHALAHADDGLFMFLMSKVKDEDRCEVLRLPILISAIILGDEERATILLSNRFSPYFTFQYKNAFHWAFEHHFSVGFPLRQEAIPKPLTWRASFLAHFQSVSIYESDESEVASSSIALSLGDPEDRFEEYMRQGEALMSMLETSAHMPLVDLNWTALIGCATIEVLAMQRVLEMAFKKLLEVVAFMPYPLKIEVCEADFALADRLNIAPERLENKRFCYEKLASVGVHLASLKAALNTLSPEDRAFLSEKKLSEENLATRLERLRNAELLKQKTAALTERLAELQSHGGGLAERAAVVDLEAEKLAQMAADKAKRNQDLERQKAELRRQVEEKRARLAAFRSAKTLSVDTGIINGSENGISSRR